MKTDLPLHPLPLLRAGEQALPAAKSRVAPVSDAAAPVPDGDLAATVEWLKLELAKLTC
jgi:hypothetical protein